MENQITSHDYEEIPPEILAMIKNTPEVTQESLREVAEANREQNINPAYQGDLLSGYFLGAVLDAMREENVTGSELARRLGKSRQYLSKLLHEENRRNFTLTTMAEIALALNRRIMPIELFNPNYQMKFVFTEGQSIISSTSYHTITERLPVLDAVVVTENNPRIAA